MELVRATISSYEAIEKRDISTRYIINEKNYKKILGFMFNEDVVDIETGKRYPIVKHDENKCISKNQDIELNKDYAIDTTLLKEQISFMLFLKAHKLMKKLEMENQKPEESKILTLIMKKNEQKR